MVGDENELPARLWRRAVRVGAGCGVLLLVVYFMAVWTKAGQLFEDTVLAAAARRAATAAALRADATLNTINRWSVLAAVVVVAGAAAVRRRPVLGALAAGVVAASAATAEIVQRALLRPVLLPHGVRREDQSFPSGHTSVAVSVMCALVLVAPRRYRVPVAAVGGVVAAGFAAATITAGWHRPSDTLGSDLIALLYACAAVALLAAGGRVSQDRAGPGEGAPKRAGPGEGEPGRGGPGRPGGRRVRVVWAAVAVLGVAAGVLVLNRLGGVGAPASLPLSVARTLAVAGSLGVALTLVLLVHGVDLAAAPADRLARGS